MPLLARVDGHWSLPAFADLFGAPPPGPGDQTWKQWWARLDQDSEDIAVPALWPFGPTETDLDRICAPPSAAHPFGHDDTGRDVLARIIRGTQTSVGLGLLGVLLAGLVGTLLGALAGHFRGFADFAVLRLIEVFMCFPMLLLLLTLAAFCGESAWSVVVVFAMVMWPSFARIVRGELLSLREREFVQAARGLGVSEGRLLRAHLLPQLRGQIGVVAAFCVANAVLAESTLSFLGIGPGVQDGSWGSILAQGKQNAHLGLWHLWLFPGLAIVGTVTTCHLLADWLRPDRA
jgi:peptide/nickel transport system permease protein